MTERTDTRLWQALRRGFLLICAAIEAEPAAPPIWQAVRRGLLLVCRAIAEEG